MAAKADFEATSIPRIGERATAELRRCRWAGLTVPLSTRRPDEADARKTLK
jgi:hypothetical protein